VDVTAVLSTVKVAAAADADGTRVNAARSETARNKRDAGETVIGNLRSESGADQTLNLI